MANTDHLNSVTKSSIFQENFVLLENQIQVLYHFTFKILFLKFNLTLANPENAQNSFSVPPPQAFHNFLYPYSSVPFFSI